MVGPLDVAAGVVAILDELGVPHVLGGSLASSIFGEPRATNDADVAVRLHGDGLTPLLHRFQELGYHAPVPPALVAVAEHGSFNVIHPSGLKVDLFVLGDDVLDRLQLERRVRVPLLSEPPIEAWVTSPADLVLRKLDWYRLGGGVSDRQWRDICGLLQVQWQRFDRDDLRRTAAEVGLGELLDDAIAAADVDL